MATERWTGVAWSVICWLVVTFVDSGMAKGQVTYQIFPVTQVQSTGVNRQPTAQTTLVSLDVADSTVLFVVNDILRQAHLEVLDNTTSPAFARHTTVKIVQIPAMQALTTALRGTGLVAKLSPDGETVVIREEAKDHRVAGGSVTGRVTDSASGQGLGGVTLTVEGTKLSTITSDSGRFTLKDVPIGDQVLRAKLFGYKPAERTVTVVDSQQITVHIVLAAVPTVLSGVVTTASGLQRKVEVGNDITTLNVDSIMRTAPISSVTDLLETRVPGLTVQHTSGVPGDPSRLRLRGASSITGNNDPIVMVDGIRVYASQSDPRNDNLAPSAYGSHNSISSSVPGAAMYAAPSPLDQIDPNDIETVEVFKGPSASALYGSDAASGVIVITTKHGRAGPTHWEMALSDGRNYFPGTWPINYFRFGSDKLGLSQVYNGICTWNDPYCKTDSVVPFQALNDPFYSILSHGSNQSSSLTISGGMPSLTYNLTGSVAGTAGDVVLPPIEAERYAQDIGTVPGWMRRPDQYQTTGVTGQLMALPSSALHLTLSSSLYNSHQQQGSLQQAISQLESQYVDPTQLYLSGTPLISGDVERATDQQVTSTDALTVAWYPYAWLPIMATGGINTMQRTDVTYIPYGVPESGPGTGQCTTCGNGDTTGTYGIGRGSTENQTVNVGTAIPTLHNRLTVGLGFNYTNQTTADFTAGPVGLAPGISVPTSFACSITGSCPISQATSAGATYGWYVEPRLNFASRFFVAPGFRLDGGSASGTRGGFSGGSLGVGTGLTGLPKIDLSYVAVDQSHPRGILTLLRPRVAFGVAGTQPGPTDKLRLLSDTVGTLEGGTAIGGLVGVTQLGNTALRPETSRELEGGVDAELWHGRVSTTLSTYNKTRYNAIIQIPVASSVYGDNNNIYKNIGVVRNTGFEMTLNAQLFQNHAFSWMVGGNLSSDHNLVVRLNPGQGPICIACGTGVDTRIVAGYPLPSDWALPIVSFADLNHDGILEPNEILLGDTAKFLGGTAPDYEMNVTTSITMLNGHLSMYATFAYQNGLTQFNSSGGGIVGGPLVLLPNAPGTSLATQAAVVAANQGVAHTNYPTQGPSGIGLVQTVNTFRFQSLSVNYELPRRMAAWFRAPRMTVALQGSNLGLHTNYRGKDPDVNAFSTVSGADETIDVGQLPEPRLWTIAINLGN